MKALLFFIGVVIGIGVCFWIFPKPPKAANTTTLQVETVGKSYLNTKHGDVLKWTDGDERPFTVTFKFGSPCKEGNTTSICTIAATGGFYKYTCPTCLDPGVHVGSAGGDIAFGIKPTPDTQSAQGAANTAEPPDPFVFCDAAKGAAAAQSIKAHVKDQIQWFPAAQIANQNWHVTVSQGVCREGTTTYAPPSPNQPTQICTVLKSDIYTVEADACKVTNGTGQLTLFAGAGQ